jgi:hypothetical protein
MIAWSGKNVKWMPGNIFVSFVNNSVPAMAYPTALNRNLVLTALRGHNLLAVQQQPLFGSASTWSVLILPWPI